jgi:hypothetical protein
VGIKLSWQIVNYQTREHEGNGNEKSCRMSIVHRLEPRVEKSSYRSIHSKQMVDIRQGLHILRLGEAHSGLLWLVALRSGQIARRMKMMGMEKHEAR